MYAAHVRSALLVLAASVGLGGCSTLYDPYGGGYGGVSVGYGSGGYYGGGGYGAGYGGGYYGDGYGSPYYGAGYGSPYYGWNDGYYYPGTGYYVYDHYRRPYRWNDAQRRYWESRRGRGEARNNWSGYGPVSRVLRERVGDRAVVTQQRANGVQRRANSVERSAVGTQVRQERRANQAERRVQRAERQVERAERRQQRQPNSRVLRSRDD